MNDTTITAGLEYIVWGFGSGEITWSPSTYLSCTYCDTASSIGTETIEYIATVTDSIGCKISDTVSIEVVINPLFVPTGFSPNGDGLNDVLKVIGGGTSYFKFLIFDKKSDKLNEEGKVLTPQNGLAYWVSAPLIRTSSEKYDYMNYIQLIGIGRNAKMAPPISATYDLYKVLY